jgi:hypothetical protein
VRSHSLFSATSVFRLKGQQTRCDPRSCGAPFTLSLALGLQHWAHIVVAPRPAIDCLARPIRPARFQRRGTSAPHTRIAPPPGSGRTAGFAGAFAGLSSLKTRLTDSVTGRSAALKRVLEGLRLFLRRLELEIRHHLHCERRDGRGKPGRRTSPPALMPSNSQRPHGPHQACREASRLPPVVV